MSVLIIEKLNKLPAEPGVYIFQDKTGKILYIGKATNLRSRVRSYFQGKDVRGERIFSMVRQIADIKIQSTDSVLEALILESNLIKKHQPKYNIDLKDDKSFCYFAITKESFPRILILRETDIDFKKLSAKNYKLSAIHGPYTSRKQMEISIKIIRKILPFHSNKQNTEKGCLDFQIGLCPGPYAGAISKKDYQKNIRGIRMILEGKKKGLIKTLEKEMKEASQKHEFEKAAEIRNKIFALQHIHDIALISKDFDPLSQSLSREEREDVGKTIRIEAYDISNISGENAVGSMVVFAVPRDPEGFYGENGEPNKKEYRKFKIKTVDGSNDVGMMREVLLRRFKNDWPMPDLILLDGGAGHVNMGAKLARELGLIVLIVGVAKGPSRKNIKLQIANSKQYTNSETTNKIQKILDDKNFIKRIMDEAHRFAISYHRKLRGKMLLTNL